MKRALSLILSLIMILSLFTAIPFSAAQTDIAATGSPELIDTVYANITLPYSGMALNRAETDYPDYRDYWIDTNDHSSEGFNKGLRFLDENNNIINGEFLECGKTYRVQILFSITGNPSINVFDTSNLRGFINGKAAEVVSVTVDKAILQTYVTSQPKEKISYVPIFVEIDNAGENLSLSNVNNPNLTWYCDTDHKYMDENDVLVKGKAYTITATKKVPVSSTTEYDIEHLTGYINSCPARLVSATADTAVFQYTFVHQGKYSSVRFQSKLISDDYPDKVYCYYPTNEGLTMPDNMFRAPEGYYFDHWEACSSIYDTASTEAYYQAGTAYAYVTGQCVIPVYKKLKTIAFSPNGGEREMDVQYVKSGDKFVLPDCTFFPPEGYEFAYWVYNGYSHAPGDKVTVRYDEVVEAYYKPISYCHIYFSPNGGGGSDDDVKVRKNGYYTLPECSFTPPSSDYEFSHWSVDGVSRRPGETIKVTKDLGIYAKWSLTKYVPVTFEPNGGSGVMAPREARRGYAYYLPNCEFTPPEGKRFDCWKVGKEYFKPSKSVTADSAITAVAQWVDAPDTINEVEVYLEKAPYADNLPSLEVDTPWFAGYSVAYDYNKQYYTNGVKWEGFTNGYNWTRLDPESTRFIEGKQYRITVLLRTDYGYEFDKDNLTATLNDEDANVLDGTSAASAYVRYTFVCGSTDLEAIPKVEVSVNFPKAGENVSYRPEVFIPYDATYHQDESYGIQWRGEADNGAFIAGETYWIIMYIIPDDGFYFDPYEDVIISVNGDEKKKDITSSQKFRIQIMYSFICEGEEEATLIGDVDADGDVDNTDAILVKRYAMNWAGSADKIKNMAAGDLNGDDKVDNTDAILLKRCVMDWPGYRDKYCKVVNG